jgi:hypothetical protein
MTFYISNITKGQHNIFKVACFRFDCPAREYHTLMNIFVLFRVYVVYNILLYVKLRIQDLMLLGF